MTAEAIPRTGRLVRTTSTTKKCRIRHRFRPQETRADHRAGTFRASGATAPPSETGTDIGRTIAASEMTDTMGYAPHSSPRPLSNIKFLLRFALYPVRTRRAFPGAFVAWCRRVPFGSARRPLDPTTAAVGTLRARACAHRSGMVAFPDPDGRRGPSPGTAGARPACARNGPTEAPLPFGCPRIHFGGPRDHPGNFILLESSRKSVFVRHGAENVRW